MSVSLYEMYFLKIKFTFVVPRHISRHRSKMMSMNSMISRMLVIITEI